MLIFSCIKLFAFFLIVLFLINILVNMLLIYLGYDPQIISRKLVIKKRYSVPLLVLFMICFHFASVSYCRQIDFNPQGISEDVFTGEWYRNNERLFFDGKKVFYSKSNAKADSEGSSEYFWSIKDYTLNIFSPDNKPIMKFRIIRVGESYRLVKQHQVEDGRLSISGFEKGEVN